MRCSNRECGATVDDGTHVCPQCGTELKRSVAPGPSEGDNFGAEAPAQASHPGRVRALANASLILAILSCPVLWAAVRTAHDDATLQYWFPPYWGAPWAEQDIEVGAPFMALAALAAIVFGHFAITRGRRVPRTGGVSWRTLFGTSFGYLNLVLIILLMFAFSNKGRPNKDLSVCAGNLKRIETALEKYSNENQGLYPPLSSQPGVLMFSTDTIPLTDRLGPLSLTCPTIRYAEQRKTPDKAESPFDDQSYFYLGYAVLNEDAVEAFAKAYRKKIAEGGTFDEDIVVEDGEDRHVLHRLSERVREVLRASQDRLSVSPYEGQEPDLNSPLAVCDDIPLLIERDLGHVYTDWDGPPHGAHVLYLNAGVQFVERGTWPMTEKTQRILAKLAE